ncbi:hypothetical protein ACWGUL_01145 [Streptomyces albidoflavus]
MTPSKEGADARVLATALRTWATVSHHPTQQPIETARIQIRQPPNWEFAGTIPINHTQHQRLLGLLREDLAEHHPAHSTPERSADVINGLITELAVAGRTRLTTADLAAAAPRIGRSRAWIAEHINHLVDSGRLIETRKPDTFRIA